MSARVTLVVAICILISPLQGFAEDGSDILLNVRTVEATMGQSRGGPQTVDPRIQDISSKLSALEYTDYRLVSSQQVRVPLKQKHSVRLAAGDKLTMRLHYLDDSRIGIWLKWVDSSGMQVLDSRMHFAPDDSIVTGVDNDVNRGRLLAIGVAR